jgi:Ni/Co efflux regulator RcnB
MPYSKLASVLVAASMLLSTVASAQQHGRGDDQRQDDRRGGQADGRRGGQGQQARHAPRQAPRQFTDGRGAGPDHAFQRGGRLPPEYRGHEYVVDDWRGHHLSQPPRGYHWVQSGGDYILVAITTGLILQLLLNH